MRADELIATRQVTPAMIGAAHDVTMKEAGVILSHELITKIYEAMQSQARPWPTTRQIKLVQAMLIQARAARDA